MYTMALPQQFDTWQEFDELTQEEKDFIEKTAYDEPIEAIVVKD